LFLVRLPGLTDGLALPTALHLLYNNDCADIALGDLMGPCSFREGNDDSTV